MPIAAVPQGLELRKISAVQKRALDDLLYKQKETSLTSTALMVGLPTVIIGGVALTYLFKDELKEDFENIKNYVQELPASTYKAILGEGFDIGKTLTGVDLSAPTPATTGTIFEGKKVCERYEYDLVTLYSKETNFVTAPLVGLQIQQKLKGMKRNNCSKPPYVEQKNWDRA